LSKLKSVPAHLKMPVAAPNMRIGLLGGSFNPAHEGHRHASLVALARLGLDRVWWLVSPGNPLKRGAKLPPLAERVAAAKKIAHHPRIVVTGFEGAQSSTYTVDSLRLLKRRFPHVNFVWLMGADNLGDVHRWRAWEEIFQLVPIAVLDRPGFRLKARASKAAQRFAAASIDESDANGLALIEPPAWTLLTMPLSGLSSTALRGKKDNGKPAKKKLQKDKTRKEKAEKKTAKAEAKTAKKVAKKAGKTAVEKEAKRAAKKKDKPAKKKTKRH
jgi:nicotinate-nucleotide adenylyltransferase